MTRKDLDFGEKLSAWLEARGWSGGDLARVLRHEYGFDKCSRSAVAYWIRPEDRRIPSGEYAAALEDLMGASWGYLYYLNPWPPEDKARAGYHFLQSMDEDTLKKALGILRILSRR